MAMHYSVGVVPARPYKPRDKAKVETGVQLVQRWIVAALRHRRFFQHAEINESVRELLVRLNERPFRKREGSRTSRFRVWIVRHCNRCRPGVSTSVSGRVPASTSTITLPLMAVSTASLTTWCTSWSRSARQL
jgi:hypothetical protein